MVLAKSKWITLVIALLFAILQTLQPFIHGHLDSDHTVHHIGFHVGGEHEIAPEVVHHDAEHKMSNVSHPSHTVSVSSGVKEDVNPALSVDTLFVVLLVIFFISVSLSNSKSYSSSNRFHYNLLKRRLPASRAPPLF